MRSNQGLLFPELAHSGSAADGRSTTFVDNLKLPVHRWFRYSAGFSAVWVQDVIRQRSGDCPARVFDPFAGSATTLIAAEAQGVVSYGIDSHPFVSRIARAKLQWRTDPAEYVAKVGELRSRAKRLKPQLEGYAPLVYKCYDRDTLESLDVLRQAFHSVDDGTAAAQLAWLTLISILRKTSHVGTAQWQYILPKKQKQSPQDAFAAFDDCARQIAHDMRYSEHISGPRAKFIESDARTCAGVPDGFATLVITSPPYPNNYDYADATRLEMSFMREIQGWGDLQSTIRRHLVRSCSQHVPGRAIELDEVLNSRELKPIASEISEVCGQLATIRKTKGGKKTYHLMVACYFYDLALAWNSLRRVCASGATVCFVIGDSAPYGIYVPVIPWLGTLAEAAGFKAWRFERTRERNVKWKNRKHRVPLQEGRLWIEG